MKIGNLEMESLAPGRHRPLSAAEVATLRRFISNRRNAGAPLTTRRVVPSGEPSTAPRSSSVRKRGALYEAAPFQVATKTRPRRKALTRNRLASQTPARRKISGRKGQAQQVRSHSNGPCKRFAPSCIGPPRFQSKPPAAKSKVRGTLEIGARPASPAPSADPNRNSRQGVLRTKIGRARNGVVLQTENQIEGDSPGRRREEARPLAG